ncbi:MAG: hypothetical protein HOP19_28715 [Acidobacteria bacterium]|nr:hypothetical protein [Acidobacteriota bacterium]
MNFANNSQYQIRLFSPQVTQNESWRAVVVELPFVQASGTTRSETLAKVEGELREALLQSEVIPLHLKTELPPIEVDELSVDE